MSSNRRLATMNLPQKKKKRIVKTEAIRNIRAERIILFSYSLYSIASREKDKHSLLTMRSHELSN